MKNQKGDFELTVGDMEEHPVWSFVPSEEWEDSELPEVSPVASTADVPRGYRYYVAGRVILNDGTEFKAAIMLPLRKDGQVQSVRLLNSPRLPNWYIFWGKLLEERTLDVLQSSLERSLDKIFPITLVSEIPKINFSFHHVIELRRKPGWVDPVKKKRKPQ